MAQLPPESATATVQRLRSRDEPAGPVQPHDPDTEQWSRAEQLLAAVRDELHVMRWLYSSAHSERGKGPKWKPEPLPRPGVTAKNKKPQLAPEQAAVLAQYLARTQGSGDVTYN